MESVQRLRRACFEEVKGLGEFDWSYEPLIRARHASPATRDEVSLRFELRRWALGSLATRPA